MSENVFEAFKYYLLSILCVFGVEKTLLKASDRICYSFLAFSDERKPFWRLQIVFAIHFERFQMKENIFEAFAFYLILILSVFWMKENTFEDFNENNGESHLKTSKLFSFIQKRWKSIFNSMRLLQKIFLSSENAQNE